MPRTLVAISLLSLEQSFSESMFPAPNRNEVEDAFLSESRPEVFRSILRSRQDY